MASLDHVSAYIEHFNSDAAKRVYARLLAAGESLAHFPHRGRPAGNGTRELPVVPPYILRYEVVGERVNILNIRHGRQASPGASDV